MYCHTFNTVMWPDDYIYRSKNYIRKTNIDIDDGLLNEAMKLTKVSSYEEVVNFVLDEYVKLQKLKKILALRGKVTWEGNLDEMRTYDKWENR